MPGDVVESQFLPPKTPLSDMSDEVLHRLALYFGVSDHAMLVRLVRLQYVNEEFYWQVKKPQYDEEDQKPKKGGGRPLFLWRTFHARLTNFHSDEAVYYRH